MRILWEEMYYGKSQNLNKRSSIYYAGLDIVFPIERVRRAREADENGRGDEAQNVLRKLWSRNQPSGAIKEDENDQIGRALQTLLICQQTNRVQMVGDIFSHRLKPLKHPSR